MSEVSKFTTMTITIPADLAKQIAEVPPPPPPAPAPEPVKLVKIELNEWHDDANGYRVTRDTPLCFAITKLRGTEVGEFVGFEPTLERVKARIARHMKGVG